MAIGITVAKYKRRFGFPDSVLSDGNAEEVFEVWRTETLPRHLSFFEAALVASPTPWLCGTRSPTVADVFLATHLNDYLTKWPDLPVGAKVRTLVDAVYALPPVADFIANEAKSKL